MTALRTSHQEPDVDPIQYGEALLTALRLKAERQIHLISIDQDAGIAAMCRLLLDIQAVQDRLGRERYRLSLFAERKR